MAAGKPEMGGGRKKSGDAPAAAPRKPKASFAARFRNNLFAGILVTAPVGITVWLGWKIVGFVDDRVRPLIPAQWNPETYLPFGLPGFGIVLVLAALILIGAVTSGLLGRLIIRYSDSLISRVPVVKSVYAWTKQVLETVLSEDSTAFREVVLIEYPCRDCWAVGFITGETKGEVQDLTDEMVYNVFVPATPNPTTGFLLFIPERDIQRLDIAVDDGIKLVISGGMVKPPRPGESDSGWGDTTDVGTDLERIRQTLLEERGWIEEERVGLLTRLRNYLFAGTLVTAPVGITVWISFGVVNFFDRNILPMIPGRWNPETYLPISLPGLGLILTVLVLAAIGSFAAGFLGRAIVRLGERLIDNLPILRGIYSAVKQIFETLFKDQSNAFREVVLIEYPRPDSWAIGFLTGDAAREIQDETPEGAVNVFLPTTPNPTSGFLLFLPRSVVKSLRMTVEEGLKMVISGGIVTPSDEPEAGASEAADNAEQPAVATRGEPR